MRIAVDLMGSDSSPQVLFNGVLQAARQLEAFCHIIVIATDSIINELKLPLAPSNLEFFPVHDEITMSDEPLAAIALKKGASLVEGIRLLKKKKIDAFISAGNTGALVASATLQIPRMPGIKRPALLVSLPTARGNVAVLDVGGNVQCKARHLVQFAQMGAAYQICQGISAPSIGLLNIGVEPQKGPSSIREAYQILQQQPSTHMRFAGNVEGRDVFQGKVDVLVTDGFAGNVFLKTVEGVAAFIFDYVQNSAKKNGNELGAIIPMQRMLGYAEYPGAFLCGIERVVIKCHGNASANTMVSSILSAVSLVKAQVIDQIRNTLTSTHQ